MIEDFLGLDCGLPTLVCGQIGLPTHIVQIVSVGIDLGKTPFHVVALGAAGKVLVRKRFTQRQLLSFTANMQTWLIGNCVAQLTKACLYPRRFEAKVRMSAWTCA